MPYTIGYSTVKTEKFNQFQTILTDLDWLEWLFGRSVHSGLVVEIGDFLQHSVADKRVDHNLPAAKQVFMDFLCMELGIVTDDYIIQNRFQVTQFHRGAVIFSNELTNFFFTGNVDVIQDDLFDIAVEIRNCLMDHAVYQHHV